MPWCITGMSSYGPPNVSGLKLLKPSLLIMLARVGESYKPKTSGGSQMPICDTEQSQNRMSIGQNRYRTKNIVIFSQTTCYAQKP